MIAVQLLMALSALMLIIKLLYHKNIPLFLLAGVLMQWLSVSIKIFYGFIMGISLSEIFSFYYSPTNIDTAFYLSIVGVVIYALGLKIGLPAYYKKWNLDLVKAQMLRMNSKKIILFYLFYSFIFGLLWKSRFIIPGINTSLLGLGFIKWGVLVVAVLSVYYKRDNVRLLFIIIIVEIVFSLVSYFSDFKTYFIFLIIVWASLERRLFSFGKILKFSFVALLLFQIAIVWTAIKGQYRMYVSGGERAQTVVVNQSSALTKLYELSSSYNSANDDQVTERLIDRIGYINFFSLTIAYVPQKRPHENGSIWLNSLTYFFMPRLFFPSKEAIDDSNHVNKYTGLQVANAQQGTSHSLGYMADSYIDFGPYGMFIPIFFIGMFTGYLYKYFLVNSYNYVWAMVFIVPFYNLTNINGMNSVKVVGNLLIYMIIAFLFNRYLAPRINHYFLK